MAKYTSNYNLHQWEPSDNFLRTDFNEDFAKIDAALTAKADKTDLTSKVDQTALEEVRAIAEGRCRVIVASYVGDGSKLQTINLGGRPKALIFPNDSVSVTIVPGTNRFGVNITNSGFTVGEPEDLSPFRPNVADKQQWYVALM